MEESEAPLLEIRGVTKRFPGVVALNQVGLRLERGEVLALIGENGAGKSTLMKILAGIQPPSEGEILLDGKPIEIETPRRAVDLGIVLIHQELNHCDNLTVAENMFLGREPRIFGPFFSEATIRSESRQYLEKVGLDVSPTTLLSTLTIGQQQLVEIAKALSAKARVLIMDEPTSSLSQSDADRLLKVVEDLRGHGVSVIYISHRLGEVEAIADRVTVFRDGENAGDLQRGEINHDAMVRLMVGRSLDQLFGHTPETPGRVIFEAVGIRTPEHPEHPISFSVRAGEVVGMAGLVGAGRTELLRVLFGASRPLWGEIRIEGKPYEFHSPRDAIRAGVALVPEDRKGEGLVLPMSVQENTSLASLRQDAFKFGFRNAERERELAIEMIEKLQIKTPGPHQMAELLSGGNQQKVVIGKWLALKPKILLLDEPTRGIDIGAKQEIYRLMEKLSGVGVAILFVSSEMEEVLGMADRVLVMHEGRLTGELPRERFSEEAIMQLATGNTTPKVDAA